MMRTATALLPFLALAVTVAGNSIHTNPSNDIGIGLSRGASDWLWAVFAIMLVSDLAFIYWSTRIHPGQRVFHQLPIIILTTAAIAYYSMASNLGQTGIGTEFHRRTTRAIWYARYIDWVITTPLLLLELLLATGMPLGEIVTVLFMDIAMIVVGLLGALVASSYKWGYFTLGMFFEFYIWWVLLGPARRTAGLLSLEHKGSFTRSAFLLTGLWLLYPVCWGLSDGSNTISTTGEMIFYGVLDILAKPVFCFYHVRSVSRISYDTYGFRGFNNNMNVGATNTSGMGSGAMMEGKSLNHPRTSNVGTVNTADTTAGNNMTTHA